MRVLDAEGGLVYQSHYKVFNFFGVQMISRSDRIPTKIWSQEEGVDDPNFVDAFNAYSRNGTASGLPVYVNFGRIEDFEVVSPSYYRNPFIFLLFNDLLFSILETIMAPNLHLTRYVWHDMEKYLGASYNVNKGNRCNDYKYIFKGVTRLKTLP